MEKKLYVGCEQHKEFTGPFNANEAMQLMELHMKATQEGVGTGATQCHMVTIGLLGAFQERGFTQVDDFTGREE